MNATPIESAAPRTFLSTLRSARTLRRTATWSARLVLDAAPHQTRALVVLLWLQGATPVVSLYLTKLVVNAVTVRHDLPVWLVPAWGAAFLLGQLAAQLASATQASLQERLTAHVERRLLAATAAHRDLHLLEDPRHHDDLTLLAQFAAVRPVNLVASFAQLTRDLVTVLGLAWLLVGLHPALLMLLVLAAAPLFAANVVAHRLAWHRQQRRAPVRRALRYVASLTTSAAHVKDVLLLGLGPALQERHRAGSDADHAEGRRERVRAFLLVLPAVVLVALSATLALWWVTRDVAAGRLAAGGVIVYVFGLVTLRERVGNLAVVVGVLGGHLQYFEKLRAVAPWAPDVAAEPVEPWPWARDVVFEHVTLRFPDGTVALDDVNLTLPWGGHVALVGENGAGKSSLVKVLTGLYRPTSGRVLVDGVDLADIPVERWRAGLTTVLQDFGRFAFTVREHATLGVPGAVTDRQLREAAQEAGFERHAERLPGGYDTQLGAAFGGTDLSGGQWQSLALTRALLRASPLLILDEPTASSDPVAQEELRTRYDELTRGRTVLLVTHHLDLVGPGDQVVVLEAGRVVEEGPAAHLEALGGMYARLRRATGTSREPA